MKKISFLLTFVALFATAGFATPRVEKAKPTTNKTFTYKTKDGAVEAISLGEGTTCTISASWTKPDGTATNIQLTVNCESCTTIQEACDQAYRLISLLIPG